jgi:hypothetical protein
MNPTMETSMVLYLVIVLFVFATMIGVLMISMQLQGELVSKNIMYAHIILAIIAIVVLAVYSFQNPDNYPKLSLILFAVAGILGIYMFSNFLKEKRNPFIVDLVYGLLAMGGFVYLIFFVF